MTTVLPLARGRCQKADRLWKIGNARTLVAGEIQSLMSLFIFALPKAVSSHAPDRQGLDKLRSP
jgi:hypothetical protein